MKPDCKRLHPKQQLINRNLSRDHERLVFVHPSSWYHPPTFLYDELSQAPRQGKVSWGLFLGTTTWKWARIRFALVFRISMKVVGWRFAECMCPLQTWAFLELCHSFLHLIWNKNCLTYTLRPLKIQSAPATPPPQILTLFPKCFVTTSEHNIWHCRLVCHVQLLVLL